MKLQNKVAVVNGAASGIGLEIARTFVREGAAKCICANVICPGFVRMPLIARQIPVKDIATVALILCVFSNQRLDGAVHCRKSWLVYAIIDGGAHG